jgi:hypothetical protein
MDDDAQRQALHIDQGVNVPGIIAGQAVMTASFSAPFKDGLTMIAAVGRFTLHVFTQIHVQFLPDRVPYDCAADRQWR